MPPLDVALPLLPGQLPLSPLALTSPVADDTSSGICIVQIEPRLAAASPTDFIAFARRSAKLGPGWRGIAAPLAGPGPAPVPTTGSLAESMGAVVLLWNSSAILKAAASADELPLPDYAALICAANLSPVYASKLSSVLPPDWTLFSEAEAETLDAAETGHLRAVARSLANGLDSVSIEARTAAVVAWLGDVPSPQPPGKFTLRFAQVPTPPGAVPGSAAQAPGPPQTCAAMLPGAA